MLEILSIYATWQFLLLCTGISTICYVVRTIIEYFILDNPNLPGNKNSRFWQDLFLQLFPVVLGIIFPIFAKTFNYPDQLKDIYSKYLFAGSAGLLSPIAYRVIKAMFFNSAGINQNPNNTITNVNNLVPTVIPTVVPTVIPANSQSPAPQNASNDSTTK